MNQGAAAQQEKYKEERNPFAAEPWIPIRTVKALNMEFRNWVKIRESRLFLKAFRLKLWIHWILFLLSCFPD